MDRVIPILALSVCLAGAIAAQPAKSKPQETVETYIMAEDYTLTAQADGKTYVLRHLATDGTPIETIILTKTGGKSGETNFADESGIKVTKLADGTLRVTRPKENAAPPISARAPVSVPPPPVVRDTQGPPAPPPDVEPPRQPRPAVVMQPSPAVDQQADSRPMQSPPPPPVVAGPPPAMDYPVENRPVENRPAQPMPGPRTAVTAYDGPMSGTLNCDGSKIPQNGEKVFSNLPPLQLTLDYDKNTWDAKLQDMDGRSQRLILRNKKAGDQHKCVVHWEVVSH